MATKDELVKLIIEGENLLSEDVNAAIADLERLGKESKEATAQLKNLQQADQAAAAFQRLSKSLDEAKDESDRLSIELKDTNKEIKELGDAAGDELTAKLNRLKREFKETNKDITAQGNELRKAETTLIKHGVSTDNLAKEQARLRKEIDETTAKQNRANAEYAENRKEIDKQVTAVRKERAERAALIETLEIDQSQRKILTDITEKQFITASRISDVLQEENFNRSKVEKSLKSENIARQKNLELYNQIALEQKRVEEATEQYSTKLREIAQRYKEGELSAEKYLATHEELRKELGLQERQVQKLRQAIERDIDTRRKAIAAAEAAEAAEEKQNAAKEKTIKNLKVYERYMRLLTRARNRGEISAEEYAAKEAKAAQRLELSAKATRAVRLEQKQLIESRDALTKKTDVLTTATRRLAQAYTVIIAAQKAIQAVTTTVRDYGELEAAITRVEKTVNLGRDSIVAMADELQTMATEITPTATNELLRFAEIAGQLGANSTEDILSLVSAADALEVSTNLAGDEAAKLLTRILTLTGEGLPKIQNLASAVVELGNNFAASEDEIVHMTKEIATAGTALDLGSSAAAAFGTTLKSIGLPAERSRTALLRLSQTIKQASVQGGDDLQALLKITNQTADEFEEAFGTAPQQTILKFLEGLQQLEASGQTVSDSLESVGITGTDALSVLEGLSKNTINLKRALQLANGAFEDSNKHFEEAAKAYAGQEAALGRLGNLFTELSARIGETYTDEVDTSIRGLTKLIDEQAGSVINVFEAIGEMTEGLFELGTAVNDMLSPLGSLEDQFDRAFNTAKIAFNGITIAARGMGLAVNEIVLEISEGLNQLGLVTDENLEKVRKRSEGLAKNIERDVNDIKTAYKRLTDESTLAYEDLISTVDKYQDAVDKLSDGQKKQLESILAQGKGVAELDETYSELTAAIIKNNREIEIKAKLEAQEEERAKQRALNEAARKKEKIELEQDVAAVLEEVAFSHEKLIAKESELQAAYEKGKITAVEYGEQQKILAAAETQLAEASNSLAEAQDKITETQEESFPQITRLNAVVEKQKAALVELEKEIARTAAGTKIYNALLAKRAELEALIQGNTERLIQMQELETKTLFQLTDIKRKHVAEMELLQNRYEIGAITAGEYHAELEKQEEKLSLLNTLIGDSSVELDIATEKTEKHTKAIREQASAVKELTEETDKNTVSLARNNDEVERSRQVASGENAGSAALIAEIGQEEYAKLVQATRGFLGIQNTSAVARLRNLEEEALRRAQGGSGTTSGISTRTSSTSNTSGGTVNYYVTITLPNGTTTSPIALASDSDARKLLDALGTLGQVNTSGGN